MSSYLLFDVEPITKSLPPRKLVFAAGAGLLVGILLTASIVHLFSSCSQHSPPEPHLHEPENAFATDNNQQKEETFTIINDTKVTYESGNALQTKLSTATPTVENNQQKDNSFTNDTKVINKYGNALQPKQLTTATPIVENNRKKEKMFTVFTDTKKSWREALADCRARNMTLASTENEDEYTKALHEIMEIGRTGDFWLSGNDLLQHGQYVWESSGRNVTWSKWIPGQPDVYYCGDGKLHSYEHCMELHLYSSYEMNDDCCSKRQNYICEYWK